MLGADCACKCSVFEVCLGVMCGCGRAYNDNNKDSNNSNNNDNNNNKNNCLACGSEDQIS